MVRLSRRVGEAPLVFRGTATAKPINDVLNGLFGMTELREPITPDSVNRLLRRTREIGANLIAG
jgi:hypothetical protein